MNFLHPFIESGVYNKLASVLVCVPNHLQTSHLCYQRGNDRHHSQTSFQLQSAVPIHKHLSASSATSVKL